MPYNADQQHQRRRSFPRRRLIGLSLAGLLGVALALLQETLSENTPEVPTIQLALATVPPRSVGAGPITPATRVSTPTRASLPTPQTATSPPSPHPVLANDRGRIALHIPAPRPPIVTPAEWGAAKPAYAYLPQHARQITLHHEGVYFDGSTPAPEYLRHVQTWSIKYRKWPDIPYHFLIDLDGLIYQGRPLDARGDTNTSYNLQDHALVALLGKYDTGEQQPRPVQIDTLIQLMAWIADTYQVSPHQIHGHRDFIPLNDKGEHIDPHTGEKITCPGDNLYRYLADLRSDVARILARTQPAPRNQ